MFGWISDRFASDEARGSLGSARTARALIARLDAEGPQYAIDELAKHCHAAPREVLATPNGARALQLVDEWAQSPLSTLWESLRADSQGQTVKEAVWSTLARYYRRSFHAYWNCVVPAKENDAKKEQPNAPLCAARSMAAFSRYMLLQHMRYLAVADESWAHVWRLIGWAEQLNIAASPLTLYPSEPAATTIAKEFLVGLLIEVAPTGNLLPGQMLAMDRVLRLHADRYRIADRFDAQSTQFSYEPGRNVPPQRYLQGLRMHGGMRFFGPGIAYAEVCKARDEAHAVRNIPQWLAQTCCSTEAYAELLERLVGHWSPEPPRRRYPRETCTGDILVAHDLATIRRLIKFSELALTGQSLSYDAGNIYKTKNTVRSHGDSVQIDSRTRIQVPPHEALANLLSFEKSLDPGATQVWQLIDSSESGVGAQVAPDCPWVKVGMVIAYRRRESVEWQVAMVRRLGRAPNGPLSIGMARMGGKVRSARLRRGIGSVDYAKSSSEIEYDAISLRESTLSLLLPVGVFDNTQKYTLTCEDRQQVVKMEKSLERRPNFECVEISEVEMLRAA